MKNAEVTCIGCKSIGIVCSQDSVNSPVKIMQTPEGAKIGIDTEGSIFDCFDNEGSVQIGPNRSESNFDPLDLSKTELLALLFRVIQMGYYDFQTITRLQNNSPGALLVPAIKQLLTKLTQEINHRTATPRYESIRAIESELTVIEILSNEYFSNLFSTESIQQCEVNSKEDKIGIDIQVSVEKWLREVLNMKNDSLSIQVKSSASKVEEFCKDFLNISPKKTRMLRNPLHTPILVLNGQEAHAQIRAATVTQLITLGRVRNNDFSSRSILDKLSTELIGEVIHTIQTTAFISQYAMPISYYHAVNSDPELSPKSRKKVKRVGKDDNQIYQQGSQLLEQMAMEMQNYLSS